jgi:hypothetical protein
MSVVIESTAFSDGTVLSDGIVRPMRAEEAAMIAGVRRYLRAKASPVDSTESTVLVWERTRQGIGGFIVFSPGPNEFSTRIMCIEALWVASFLPPALVERALLRAAEQWEP